MRTRQVSTTMAPMAPTRTWFNSLDERLGDGLEAVLRRHHRRRLDRLGWRHVLEPREPDTCWSTRAKVRPGNQVEVFIDGAAAFGAMAEAIREAQRSVHIAGWHASPDFALVRDGEAATLRELLTEAAQRLPVRLLLWAGPPLPAFLPTRRIVRRVRDDLTRDTAITCALDSRERTLHCHHEKIVVIDDDLAFVSGLDFTALEGDRYDEPDHPPRDPLGWHDLAVRLRGPAVVDVARHFVQRWGAVTEELLPWPLTPKAAGPSQVQVLRTVPDGTYQFSPSGEFTILESYLRAFVSAKRFIYVENQFLWSPEVIDVLVEKLKSPPSDDFRILLVLPVKPSDGAETTRGQLSRLLDADAGSGRVLATTIIGHDGGQTAPVYIHAKVAVVDDEWLTIGSANLNEHSLLNDTEMNIATTDAALARQTRLRLWAEHTQRPLSAIDGEPCQLIDDVWRPIAEEQARRARQGQAPTHRLTLLTKVSRRGDRLEGPVRGLLVDG